VTAIIAKPKPKIQVTKSNFSIIKKTLTKQRGPQ